MRRREKGRFTAGGAAMPLAFLLIAYPLFPTAWTSAPIAAAESLGRANFRPTHTILEPERKTGSHVNNLYGKLPLSFEINRGQSDSRVQFLSRGQGYALMLTGAEAILSLERSCSSDSGPGAKDRTGSLAVPGSRQSRIRGTASTALRLKPVGGNTTGPMEGIDQLPGKSNYFLGSDSSKWQTDVPTYSKVRQKGVYTGIDLVWYGNQQQLEYDFIVAPGANPRVIDLSYEGISNMRVDANGDLILAAGSTEIRQHKPNVYQEANGIRKQLVSRYVLKGRHRTGIRIESYDRRRPLIIDPVLSYSTYFGSSGSSGWGIAVDSSGSAYVTGMTGRGNFPVTPGSYRSNKDDSGAIYVAKLNAAGSAIVYSAYIGGSALEYWPSIAVDSEGNAYVAGNTQSRDFPVTPGAFQTTNRSILSSPVQGFVAKLNSAGSRLTYSTYIGGTSSPASLGTTVNGIEVDGAGNAYLTGKTDAPDFPTTAGAFRTALTPLDPRYGSHPASADVFVTKFTPSGSSLVYSTFQRVAMVRVDLQEHGCR